MRKTLLILGAVLCSACAVEAGDEPPIEPGETAEGEPIATEQAELYKAPGNTTDGTACCAIDYRSGGEVVVCGTRSGEWCCNSDESECASCHWYECEPPPEQTYTPIIKPVFNYGF